MSPLCKRGAPHVYMPTDEEPPALADVVAKVRAAIEGKTFRQFYADYDDELRPEQVQVLLAGENPYESKEFDFLEQNVEEYIHHSAVETLKEFVTDEEWAVLEDTDEHDDLLSEVMYADTSDPIYDMLRNTGSMLLRYDLDVPVDTDYSSDENTLIEQASAIVNALGVTGVEEATALGQRIVSDLLPEASYGERAQIIWYADVADVVKVVDQISHGNTATAAMTFANGYIMVYDGWNGSGHDIKVDGPFTVPFLPENIRVDACASHSWDSIAGVVHSAYAADVTFTVTDTKEGGTNG